jgi:hypothetical protein
MAGIAWCGGRGLIRVETCARGPSRPRKSRCPIRIAYASRAPMRADADPGGERKSHATLSLRRGYGKKTLFDQWVGNTRRGMTKIFDTRQPAVMWAGLAGPTAPGERTPSCGFSRA